MASLISILQLKIPVKCYPNHFILLVKAPYIPLAALLTRRVCFTLFSQILTSVLPALTTAHCRRPATTSRENTAVCLSRVQPTTAASQTRTPCRSDTTHTHTHTHRQNGQLEDHE